MMQLNDDYQRDDFIKFLEEDFLTDFKRDIRPVNTSSLTCIQKASYLGESKNLDLQVFEFLFEGSPNKRIALTKDAFSVMRSSAIYNALAIFHSSDNKDWRFSLMTATPEPTEKGKVTLTYSNPKRLSFFLGTNAKINTPTKFLFGKGKIINFEDLNSRFSIEVVNKEFYKEISQAFTKLVGGLLKLPSAQDKGQTNLEFAVRLIGRIIFCWFLREKKSNSGLSLMPKKLLSLEAIENNKDFYHKILEPIFFEILNKPVKSRREDFAKEPFSSVPYLNGGLFSPQEDDFYKRMNGDLQSQFHNTLIIPDSWLKDFFEILETYNFTIDENTSYDEELSIDPEMLGRIFENLLAEINPETGESARKSTGSYYTPRVIVNYMVDESLLFYLKEQTGIKENKLKGIISYDLDDDVENPIAANDKEKIIDALEKVKILDPACGSGAFPIGALQKIVFILQQTDSNGQLWFKKQIKNTSPEIRRVIEREFKHENFDYIRKLGIIRENIYGVDIQPIATEISRLRCFLTLIVDERIQDGVENRGIEPLPNLDFKFVTANSLIGLPKIDQSQGSMFDDYQKIDDLKNIRDQYFNASGIEREQLKTEFVMQQKRLVDQLIKEHGFMGVAKAELTQKLTDWEPFTHKSTLWFDPEWMFGIKSGFDVVIGNPPYLRVQGIDRKSSEIYKKLFKSATGSYDLYVLFSEKAISLINDQGTVNFIMPHKWINSSFGVGLREETKEKIFKLISFKEYQVFNASTYTSLVWFIKSNNHFQYIGLNKDLQTGTDLAEFLTSIDENSFTIVENSTLTNTPWIFSDNRTSKVLNKLSQQSFKVKNIFEKVFQGIASGKDSVYFLEECQQKENNVTSGYSHKLKRRIDIETAITRPLVKGNDIHRYSQIKSDKVVVLPYHTELKGNKESSTLYTEVELSEQNPKAYAYLKECEKVLRERESGRFDINGKWFQFSRNQGISRTEEEKIIMPYLTIGSQFAYDKTGQYYCNTKCFGLIKRATIVGSYVFYLAILNSKLLWFFMKTTSAVFRGGYYTFTKETIEPFPIPTINNDHETKSIEILANKILEAKTKNPQSETFAIENQIDQLVYKLYGLTSEEIDIVESSVDKQ